MSWHWGLFFLSLYSSLTGLLHIPLTHGFHTLCLCCFRPGTLEYSFQIFSWLFLILQVSVPEPCLPCSDLVMSPHSHFSHFFYNPYWHLTYLVPCLYPLPSPPPLPLPFYPPLPLTLSHKYIPCSRISLRAETGLFYSQQGSLNIAWDIESNQKIFVY